MINLTFSHEKTERKHLIYIYVPLRPPKSYDELLSPPIIKDLQNFQTKYLQEKRTEKQSDAR
jgi:hypothetical protein